MKVQFASRGWEDYLAWQQDRQMLKRANTLIEDIRRNGHQGIGKPEQLRGNWAGFWSRRIDQEHRLVCRIVGLTVLFAQ
ncbi:Txe/YoeB family addiction module toxin [Micromonospora sp. NBRC 110038]|uniref:Txe/YoeB family addiction module toxin n=1 Tax=Micromonospora sp. NBRC 110038 TaxID=1550034 RepID=UPI001E619746|nr:Txe/YoeB family addiction module toxin [Micromonospora sp. NBRC 110038]